MSATLLFTAVLILLSIQAQLFAAPVPVDSAKGRVAILKDSFPARPANADPDILAAALEAKGYGVTFLKAGDMADSPVLSTKNFDCIIFPYGSNYPDAAFDSILAYLKSGGSFVSMGGYALDEPCKPDAAGKLAPQSAIITATDPVHDPRMRCLNTRYGKPADTLGLQPDQIGIFDPCYHLRYATSFASAPMQHITADDLKSEVNLDGYAACSMLGSNHPIESEKWGRHVPLVDAFDSLGRYRGGVGAIAHNYAGPYAKSSWAFFGVTNTDLFAKGGPMLPYLGSIVDSVIRKTYLHSLATDLAIYKNGETVKLTCNAADFGKKGCAGSIIFRIFDRDEKQIFASKPINIDLKADSQEAVKSTFRPGAFTDDLYRLTAELSVGGKIVDEIESGFMAYDSSVTAGGLHLVFHDNYFYDGKRPVLFSGTNVTGAMLYSENENPLVWDRDLAKMSESGINIMRIMHILKALSPPDAPRLTPDEIGLDNLPVKAERWFDGLMQLSQKHKVAILFSPHAYGAVLTKGELEQEKKFSKLIAARYKNVPGFFVDIENEPNVMAPMWTSRKQWEPLNRDWNEFLREKYGSDNALKSAWQISPPEAPLGGVLCKAGTDKWDDIRTLDEAAFSNLLAQRWVAANYAGLKEGNQKVPVSVGFLQEYWALNKLACMDFLDFADMHSYTSIEDLRDDMKLFDRRFNGKSLSLGEFGSVADHSARNSGADNKVEDYTRYLLSGHYLFGEGGSFIANWC